MRIQHNIMAMNAYRNLNNNNNALSGNLEKLSSGYRINRAGDDAAGLAISEKMRAQITGLDVAQDNAQSGINLVQTAEGALTEVHDMLNRMYELAEQSANGTYDDTDRVQLQKEVNQLKTEINRIADSSNFNGINLLDGSLVADNTGAFSSESMDINIADGITINAPVDGAGKQAGISATFGKAFGTGDTITLTLGDGTSVTMTYDASSNSATQFTGTDLETQLNNLKTALSTNSALSEYNITVENGNSLKLEAKQDGTPTTSISNISVNDQKVSISKDPSTVVGSAGTEVIHSAENMGWNDLLAGAGNNGGVNPQKGDTFTFEFEVNGRTQTVTLTATDKKTAANQFVIGTDNAETTSNLVDALKNAKFDNNPNTVLDESKMLVSDYFTINANQNNAGVAEAGSINVVATTTDTLNKIGDVKFTLSGGSTPTTTIGETIGKDAIVEKYAFTTAAGTSASSSSATLADTSIDLSSSAALTTTQVGSLAGTSITMNGYTVNFKDADSYTGAIDEVLLTTAMGGDDLLEAIEDSLNAQDDYALASALSTGTATQTDYTFDLSGCGAASGVINAGTNNMAAVDYTIGTTTPLEAADKETTVMDFTNNFEAGDTFKLSGQLSDGRIFEVELKAEAAGAASGDRNAFEIGATTTASLTNLANALKSGNVDIVIDGKTYDADELFGSGNALEFDVSASGTKLTITSNVAGEAGNGKPSSSITSYEVGTAELMPDQPTITQGKDASQSLNQIQFDPTKIEQGTSITIDGKTYEFVTDPSAVSKSPYGEDAGNVAVVVTNLGSDSLTGDDLVNALISAMDGADGTTDGTYITTDGKAYNMTLVTGEGILKIESQTSGDGATALTVTNNAEAQKATVVKFGTTNEGTKTNPNEVLNVKVGDSITINGKVYEFTDGKNRTENADAEAVVLTEGMTAKEAAEALAAVVNEKDGDKVTARVGEEGELILTSKYNWDAYPEKGEDPLAAPEVELPKGQGLVLQIGDTSADYNQLNVEIKDCHVKSLGLEDLDIGTQKGAKDSLDFIKSAINYVSDVRGTLGATQNRLDHTINNLSVMEENITDAESNIRDTDVAEEMMEYTKNNILIQSAQAMLAQANQVPQGVLQLLG